VVGERLQGTLEPVLATPLRTGELLLGKAAAAFVPAVAISYGLLALFIASTEAAAHDGVASLLLRGPDVLALLIFTPLLAAWSICVGIAISTKIDDPRAATPVATIASLPTVGMSLLVAYNVLHVTEPLAFAFGLLLLLLSVIGAGAAMRWFDRERLITNADAAGGARLRAPGRWDQVMSPHQDRGREA
jgi:ABC-2 type transport system permease protein